MGHMARAEAYKTTELELSNCRYRRFSQWKSTAGLNGSPLLLK